MWLPINLLIYSFTKSAYLSRFGQVIGLALIAFHICFVFESTCSYTTDGCRTNARKRNRRPTPHEEHPGRLHTAICIAFLPRFR